MHRQSRLRFPCLRGFQVGLLDSRCLAQSYTFLRSGQRTWIRSGRIRVDNRQGIYSIRRGVDILYMGKLLSFQIIYCTQNSFGSIFWTFTFSLFTLYTRVQNLQSIVNSMFSIFGVLFTQCQYLRSTVYSMFYLRSIVYLMFSIFGVLFT